MSKTAALTNKLYFITMTIVDWIDVFTIRLYKDFIVENLQYCQKNKGLEIYEYVIMTNYIHMICASVKVPLSDIIRDFKSYTSKELVRLIKENPLESRKQWMLNAFSQAGKKNYRNKNNQVWQNNNWPTLLSSNYLIDQKTNYIHNDPVVAGFVSDPCNYLYSSACIDSPLNTLDF